MSFAPVLGKLEKRMAISGETKKNLLLALVIGILSLVLFAVVIEVFLGFKYEQWKLQYAKNSNWYGGLTTFSKNPILMWEYRANDESNVPNMPKIRTNRHGFRDYDYEVKANTANLLRISFLGDSVTLGLKVDSQDTFVNKFTAYAAEKHPGLKIQSLNHGIDGYNTIQIFELLTSKVLQFGPGKVVYVMCLNDFDFEESSGGKIRYFKKPNSFILEKLERLYRRFLRIDFHIWHFKKNKQQVFDKIINMKELLKARNIDLQIAVLPVFKFKDFEKDWNSYPLSQMHFAIRQFLIKEQIKFVDLLESFRNQEKPPAYFAHDIWHPNKEGHDFIAKQLLQFFLKDI